MKVIFTWKNSTYDFVKKIIIAFPFFITFFSSLSEIWTIPYSSQITLTLTAVNALLCGVFGITNSLYKKG